MGKGFYAGNFYTRYRKASALRRGVIKSRKFGMSRTQFKKSFNTKFLSPGADKSVSIQPPLKRYKTPLYDTVSFLNRGEWNQPLTRKGNYRTREHIGAAETYLRNHPYLVKGATKLGSYVERAVGRIDQQFMPRRRRR